MSRIFGLGKVIFYSPWLARHLGVRAAILASQIMYWQEHSPEGVRKSAQAMSAETGLSVQELRTARRKLREAGLLVEVRQARHVSCWIDEVALRALWAELNGGKA